jgi:type IV secretory pathway VirB2 component (pilin)
VKKLSNMMSSMSRMNEKLICTKVGTALTAAMLLTTSAFAASDYDKVVNPVISLLNSLLGPFLGIVAAVGVLYCVLLGVKFAKAEEPQDREKARTHLKNAIIGFVLIFVLIVLLKLGTGVLLDWVKSSTGTDLGDIPSGN